MGCCKCELEYSARVSPRPAVYADPVDGKEYCVFHAPKDKKHKALGSKDYYTVEEFNDLIFALIDAVITREQAGEKNAKSNLRHTVFPGDISFSRYGKDNPLPRIDFSEATFSGTTQFSSAMFSGLAGFFEATFSGEAKFDKTMFSGMAEYVGTSFIGAADFSHAAFTEKAMFNKTTFSSFAGFSNASFGAAAGFSNATFHDSAGFQEADFGGAAGFSNSTFRCIGKFTGAKFGDVAGFGKATFNGTAVFTDANFTRDASFVRAIFNADAQFVGALFEGPVQFSSAEFFGKANFHNAQLCKVARYYDARFNGVAVFTWARFEDEGKFRGAHFGAGANFRDMETVKEGSLRMLNLNAISLGHLMFTSVEAPSFTFRNCDWPEHLGLEKHSGSEGPSLLELEELYRAMKQRADDDHDRPQVSHWHFREKLMAMRRGGNGIFEAVMLRLYYFTSGFGERPIRAGCCLAGLVALPLLIFAMAKLASTGLSLQLDSAAITEVFSDWQRALPLSKVPSEPLPSAWKLWAFYILQLLIALQAALLGFAVRNRFRR
ncbi:MAG: hypothetical protein A2051_11955 [Desulfovibrionales bacterium GWA2_65_9]|nr:MAG: hypothetical protein A2051_11955 [Desulfovibrionales bacterium GWA2_65_9]